MSARSSGSVTGTECLGFLLFKRGIIAQCTGRLHVFCNHLSTKVHLGGFRIWALNLAFDPLVEPTGESLLFVLYLKVI